MQLNIMCNLSYATTQICSCMCRMQLNFTCKRQVENPKFLAVNFANHSKKFMIMFIIYYENMWYDLVWINDVNIKLTTIDLIDFYL
jgi:hypothetical protein